MTARATQLASRAPEAGETLDPVRDPRWRSLVERAPEAGIFHHPAWLGLLQEHYRYPLAAWCAADRDGDLRAGLPVARVESRLTGSRIVALPFSDLCGPVLDAGAGGDAERALCDVLEQRQRAAGLTLEVRSPLAALPEAESDRRLQHVLALSGDIDEMERGFRKSQVKRGIAKARREGVRIERRGDRTALREFYGLHLRTRRRQGIPTQPWRFIEDFAGLFERGLGFVLVARLERQPLAAAVFLGFNGTLTYKYGASDERHLDKRPNNLLFREAIAIGCAEGFHTLDFGRTDSDNQGLAAFKRGFGAEERELVYTYLPDAPRSVGGSRGARVLGAVIRKGPPIVSRAVGQALYRHLA